MASAYVIFWRTADRLRQDGKRRESANETGAPPVQLISRYGKADSGESSQHRSQGDLRLGFCNGSADTAVDPVAEAEVYSGVSVQVEQVW
jgi:hypothetical protein